MIQEAKEIQEASTAQHENENEEDSVSLNRVRTLVVYVIHR